MNSDAFSISSPRGIAAVLGVKAVTMLTGLGTQLEAGKWELRREPRREQAGGYSGKSWVSVSPPLCPRGLLAFQLGQPK